MSDNYWRLLDWHAYTPIFFPVRTVDGTWRYRDVERKGVLGENGRMTWRYRISQRQTTIFPALKPLQQQASE